MKLRSKPDENAASESRTEKPSASRQPSGIKNDSIQAQVERRFGVLPNFFGLAMDNPEITANLWGFACFAYLDNPLPSLFKERLFVYVSRFCDMRYCIARHVGFLVGLGHASGDAQCAPQSVEEVVRLICRPFPRGKDLEPLTARCAACDSPLAEMPAPDSPMEHAIFACASHVFVQTRDAPRCIDALKRALGEGRLQHLLVFLAFIRTAHYWTRTHSDLTMEEDIRDLLATHERLAQCVLNDSEAGACESNQNLMNELTTLRQDAARHNESLQTQRRESEKRLRVARAELRESEEEIRRARDYAEATLRSSPVPLLVLENDLRVVTANEAFYKTFQVPPTATQGRLVYQLGSGQWNIPELRQLLEDVLPGQTVFRNFEVTHDFETVGRRAMLLNARRMENEAGSPERIVLVIEDITERKQTEEALRESEARFRMMADNISQLAWICDQLGNVTWYNQRWLDYTGLTFEEMRDWGWKKVHHPDHVDRVVASVTRSRESGEVWDDTFPLRGKDGNYRWFLSRAVPIKDADGNIVRWFGTNTDITEQRNSEEALRRAHELLTNEAKYLEALVQERTASLQETIADLEHFSYTITHDMRAPLRAMQGFGGMLLEDRGNSLTPESADSLRRIMDAAQRMDALIRDSLQYARVVREQPPLGAVDPGPVLSTILRSYPSLQPPGVEIQVIEPLPPVTAAETGLAQCFSNLLVNAVKFVRAGITPKVRIWAEIRHQSNPETVRFWFEDNGIGIPSQYQARIFDMFQQLDKNYEGTGIGLALVRKTVERMKGKVGVESEPGKGSRFWLELTSASRA